MMNWAIGGGVLAGVIELFSGNFGSVGGAAIVGAIFGVSLRKWIFRNFWM